RSPAAHDLDLYIGRWVVAASAPPAPATLVGEPGTRDLSPCMDSGRFSPGRLLCQPPISGIGQDQAQVVARSGIEADPDVSPGAQAGHLPPIPLPRHAHPTRPHAPPDTLPKV